MDKSECICLVLMCELETKKEWIITNVYAPTTMVGRRGLWRDLCTFRSNFLGRHWVTTGDFNYTLRPSNQKSGNELVTLHMEEFSAFFFSHRLLDVELVNGKFTWTNRRQGEKHI